MEVLEGVKTFEDLQSRTKIGTGCGKCIKKAKEVLDMYVKKYYKDPIYKV